MPERSALPPSSFDPIALAEAAWRSGNDAEAESILLEERRRALLSGEGLRGHEAELGLARYALTLDDDERAAAHLLVLESGAPLPAHLGLAVAVLRLRLGRRAGHLGPLPDEASWVQRAEGAGSIEGQVEALVELAAALRVRGEIARARALLDRVIPMAPEGDRARALVEMERAELSLVEGDPKAARTAARAALALFVVHDLRRDEGRAQLRYGEAIAGVLPDDDPAAIWLGRAQSTLGAFATFRDRAALRAAYRHHGRRLRDHAIAESISARVDALERTCALLRGAVATKVGASDRETWLAEKIAPEASAALGRAREAIAQLPGAIAPLVSDVERVASDLVELMGEALVERNRMRALLLGMAHLDGLAGGPRFADEAARLASVVLDADRVVIARAREGVLTLTSSFVARGREATPELWQPAIEAALRSPSAAPEPDLGALRKEGKPRGPVLVMPIRSSSFAGALYADKLQRSGYFRDTDHYLASLTVEFLAQGFGQIEARDAEKLALAQLEATLDAIRDGVVALDAQGVVTSRNSAAARLLRVPAAELLGKRLADVAHLEPLSALLSSARREDGTVVRLSHGSLVVSARPIDGFEEGARGLVVTLVELDRAERIAMRITHVRPRYGFHDLIGRSDAMNEAISLARQAAAVDASVLITGESGTGKEVIAQAIHTGGARAGEAFVGINCAALPRELLEAELFGHERGAFTGARSEGAMGKFEQAGEGTLLLDEIGDMPLDMQVKLLRVLQERTVVRLGGSEERPMLARIVATTHRNLERAVERGTFRLDLLFRLRVLHIHLPPLRERPEDIEAIGTHLLGRVAVSQRKRVRRLGPELLRALQAHSWPGNIRELANVMEREVSLLPESALALERFQVPLGGSIATPEGWAVEPASGRYRAPSSLTPVTVGGMPPAPLGPAAIIPLVEVERRAFVEAYAACNNSVSRAAKALGVSKVTFYAKLRQWGMHPGDESSPDSVRTLPPPGRDPAD